MKQNENFSCCEKYLFFEALYQTDGVRLWKNKWSYFSWTKRFLVPGFRWGERIKKHAAENRTRKSWDLCSGFSILKMTEHKWEREMKKRNLQWNLGGLRWRNRGWFQPPVTLAKQFRVSLVTREFLSSTHDIFFTQKLFLSLTRYYNLG